jgi:hypothetical protein
MGPDDALTPFQLERDQQSSNTYCTSLEDFGSIGVGVYKNSRGAWYATQLFK